jgi:hypothetical protein
MCEHWERLFTDCGCSLKPKVEWWSHCYSWYKYTKSETKEEKEEHVKNGGCDGTYVEKEEPTPVANPVNMCAECWKEYLDGMYG